MLLSIWTCGAHTVLWRTPIITSFDETKFFMILPSLKNLRRRKTMKLCGSYKTVLIYILMAKFIPLACSLRFRDLFVDNMSFIILVSRWKCGESQLKIGAKFWHLANSFELKIFTQQNVCKCIYPTFIIYLSNVQSLHQPTPCCEPSFFPPRPRHQATVSSSPLQY